MTLMVQLAPATRVLAQVLLSLKLPVVATLLIESVESPVLVRVTFCAMLAVRTSCGGKVKLVGEKVTMGPPLVPETGTLCGFPGALSAIDKAAVRVPDPVGVKVTLMVHVPCGVTVVQLFVWLKSLLLLPVKLTLVTSNVVVPVFVKVTVCGGLVVPIA